MLNRAVARLMRVLPTDVGRVKYLSEQLYRRIGGGGYSEDPLVDAAWPAELQPPIKAKRHAMRFELNLRDWLERRLYFFGVYYQEELERLLLSLLREGDQFVDIGANIGVMTLLAASAIGAKGRCHSFEPNPRVFERLKRHVELNRLTNVDLHQCALAEEARSAELYLPGDHAGVATMRGPQSKTDQSVTITTLNGDEALAGALTVGPVLVKIDVEGYEAHVLRGLPRLLARKETAWLVEITDRMLRDCGDTASQLYATFTEHGYSSYRPQLPRGRFKSELRLERHSGALDLDQYDALFVRDDDPVFGERVAHFRAARG